jgi:class 3 adenylate cyclase
MVTCPSCGQENPDGFTFCGRCATRLEPSGTQEERRICTVVFCDLVGFTKRSESLDPEDVRAFLLPYYDLMTEEVTRYGGVIDKLYGDGALAVFGVPAAHEDDPERAIRASLRVLERLPDLGSDLHARIGINTGEVVVAADRAARGDALTGDTVNTASRIQSAAPVGSVVVGELAYVATKHVFDYEVLDPVEVKGKVEPIAVFRPLAPIARQRVEATETTPFVGRDAELAELIEAFERARTERNVQVRTIVAEPGLGKSRLVRELSRYVDGLPDLVTWREGRCLHYGEGISFWALGEIVKSHAGIQDTDDQATIAAKLNAVLTEPDEPTRAWLTNRLAPLVGLETSGAAPERKELFTAWRGFFASIAAADPLVLVIEDLHWGDDALVAFLDELRSTLGDTPVLLLVTARPNLAERHPGWQHDDPEEIRLGALDDGATAALVATLFDGASDSLVAKVRERAGGSPLYVEQLAAARRSMPIAGASEDDLPLPASIQALLAARIDELPAELRTTLLDASVVGKTFWAGAIAHLGSTDVGAVEKHLSALIDREFVRSIEPSTISEQRAYTFAHALVRDAAYAHLSRRPRLEKHRAVATWIVQRVGRPLEDVAEIVVAHLDVATEVAESAGWTDDVVAMAPALADALVDAGRHASAVSALDAGRFFLRGLELIDHDDRRRAAVLLEAADILSETGERTHGPALVDEAIPMLRRDRDWDRLGEALTLRAFSIYEDEGEEACIRALREAEQELTAHPSEGLVTVLSNLAEVVSMYSAVDDPGVAIAVAERAAEVAGVPIPIRLVACRAAVEIAGGDTVEGAQRLREAATQALNQADPMSAAAILNDAGAAMWRYSTWADALAILDESVGIAATYGLDPIVGQGPRLRGLLQVGRWDEVAAQAPDLIASAKALGNSTAAQSMHATYASMLLDRGRAWLDALDQTGFRVEDMILPLMWNWSSCLRVELTLDPTFDLDGFEAQVANLRYVQAAPMLIDTLVRAGRLDIAERIRARYDAPMPIWDQPNRWSDAYLAEARGEFDAAEADFVYALAASERIGSRFEQADQLYHLGRCAAARGEAKLARDRLERSRALWDSMDAAVRAAEADEALSVL